jgi:hypothetical protein
MAKIELCQLAIGLRSGAPHFAHSSCARGTGVGDINVHPGARCLMKRLESMELPICLRRAARPERPLWLANGQSPLFDPPVRDRSRLRVTFRVPRPPFFRFGFRMLCLDELSSGEIITFSSTKQEALRCGISSVVLRQGTPWISCSFLCTLIAASSNLCCIPVSHLECIPFLFEQ